MPTVTNRKTGKTHKVSAEELETIKNNKLMASSFTYKETPVPEEVQELKAEAVKELPAEEKPKASKSTK